MQGTATLTMASTSTLAIGSGKTLTIDGTLNATGGTIKALSGSYAFKVGSSATASPDAEHHRAGGAEHRRQRDADQHGQRARRTTFTHFDNIAFNAIGATGAGTQYLQIGGSPLYLVSHAPAASAWARHTLSRRRRSS